jgi:hypothetical protein
VAASKAKSKLGIKASLRFMIGLSDREIFLLRDIITFLGCGTLYINTKAKEAQLTVNGFYDVINTIIPLINKCPLEGVKALDFKDWCKVADLMVKGHHLTADGLVEIQKIKAEMNSKRAACEDPAE